MKKTYKTIIVSVLFLMNVFLVYCVYAFHLYRDNDVKKVYNIDYASVSLEYSEQIEIPAPNFVSYEIKLPLVSSDYYYGKFENATAGVNEFMDSYIYKLGEGVGLLENDVISLKDVNSYIMTSKGYGYGVCWFVTALGGLIDEVNSKWMAINHTAVFTVTESHPHSTTYQTYFPNRYYGYAIYNGDYVYDYSFVVSNPEVREVHMIFTSQTDNPNAYMGYSIDGKVIIFLS